MNKKPMGKKATMIGLAIVIAAAVFLGIVLLNKGDGPVTGMILSDKAIEGTNAYADVEKTHGDGVYLVVSNSFNQYQTDYETDIPRNETLYAAVYFVECPQGSMFTAKWSKDGAVIAQEDGTLSTEPMGVITYKLDGTNVTAGDYTFALYQDGGSIFQYSFTIE